MAEFVAQLRQLFEHCQFHDTSNNMLCDQIVCGINYQCIQRCLLAESDLTLARTMELSLVIKSADKDANTLKYSTTGTSA